ncbi:MAG: hypothetical protein H6Q89_837 [Myxococcaceae bacterium]|nr:hypothetical protein [Myxococcaceae bacterium]
MIRLLALGLLTLGSVSFAASPRLFPQPSVLTLLAPEVALTEPQIREPHVPTLLASGAFAALIATPLALAVGAEIGKGPKDLYAALVPSLLTTLLIPPLAVVLTEWMVAERTGKGRFRLVPTLLVAILGQAAIMGAGVLLGVNATTGAGVAVITLASAVVLPTATTAMLKLTERPPAVSVPVLSGNF